MRTSPIPTRAFVVLLAALAAASPLASTATTRATHTAAARRTTTAHRTTPPRTATASRATSPRAAADSTGAAARATAPADAPTGTHAGAAADSGYIMPGGQEGTVFKSLTVQGEDRVHFEFERPELSLDLDPHKAPGLDPGSAQDMLTRSGPDLVRPFAAGSAGTLAPELGHPWLSAFVHGPVARFHPQVTEVARWKLTIANAKGESVALLQGEGSPPREIAWDGRATDGSSVLPELTYSYVFEAKDRAGNKRNFLGEGFRVSAYRMDTTVGPRLVFGAGQLAWPAVPGGAPTAPDATPPILLEVATCLNQVARPERPVAVTATARDRERAQALAAQVARLLAPHLVGDPLRVTTDAVVEPDAPEAGTVAIQYR